MTMHLINGKHIRTTYEYPPIPVRNLDWSAIDDDTYDGADDSHCPIGRGATEQEAIDDLLEQLEEQEQVETLSNFIVALARKVTPVTPLQDDLEGRN